MLLDTRRNEIVGREYVDSLKKYKEKKKTKVTQNEKIRRKRNLSPRNLFMMRERGVGRTQLNQKKVSLLRWKDILTWRAVVWCGRKSLGPQQREPGFATHRW